MATVISKDGTSIAYDRAGEGPSVIMVGGALGVRSHPTAVRLAELLSEHFTVFNYNRRGRVDSGDTLPYAIEREIEDIEALIDEGSGPAYLFGMSSGAALVLVAANKLPSKVRKLALYEVPFIVDDKHPPLPDNYVGQLNEMVAANRRGDAVALFMKVVGVPDEYLEHMRQDPSWKFSESLAHTIAYDGTIMGNNMSGKPLEPNQWPNVTAPTLVVVGDRSGEFFVTGARELITQLPDARLRMLEGQIHDVNSEVLAPVLVDFFKS